jgi:hypothetical protein
MLGISWGGAVFVPKRSTFVPVLSTRNFVKFHLIEPVLPLCTCRSDKGCHLDTNGPTMSYVLQAPITSHVLQALKIQQHPLLCARTFR